MLTAFSLSLTCFKTALPRAPRTYLSIMNQVVLASSQSNHAPRVHNLSRHSKQPHGSNSSRPPSHRASCRVLDSQRQTMDMYYEPRPRRQYRRPRKTVRFLDEDDVISYHPRDYHAAGAALISRHELPNGRPRWSCQPCAQQALDYIRAGCMIQIPVGIGTFYFLYNVAGTVAES